MDALGRSHPEVDDLRERALRGRRLTDPPRRKGSAFLAGALSLALAVTSFVVLRDAFREEPEEVASPETPSPAVAGALDPAEICDVPAFDPSVALLGDGSAGVFGTTGPGEFPLEVLDASGQAASAIEGPAADALRSFLEEPQATHAPSAGWRAIRQTPEEVIFAAPPEGGYSDWWVTRFTLTDGAWTARESELVDQHQTPAQRGWRLSLSWGETTVVDDGAWGSTLHLTNDREASWSSGRRGMGSQESPTSSILRPVGRSDTRPGTPASGGSRPRSAPARP